MTEVLIRLAEQLPAPELTVIEEDGARRSFFVNEERVLQVLRSALDERVVTHQRYFPATLLGGDMLHSSIWWRPPGPQMLTVEKNNREQVMLTVPLPGLVLGIGKQDLHLVAIKGLERPQADSPLFLAPFPNVGSGSVCMGSGDRAEPAMVTQPELAWDALWGSAFTDHSESGQSRKYPYDVRELLFELDGQEAFPEDDLVSTEACLEDLIHACT